MLERENRCLGLAGRLRLRYLQDFLRNSLSPQSRRCRGDGPRFAGYNRVPFPDGAIPSDQRKWAHATLAICLCDAGRSTARGRHAERLSRRHILTTRPANRAARQLRRLGGEAIAKQHLTQSAGAGWAGWYGNAVAFELEISDQIVTGSIFSYTSVRWIERECCPRQGSLGWFARICE